MTATIAAFYEAFNAGDFDAAAALAHPEIEFDRVGGMSPLSGSAAIRQWMEPDAFEWQHLEPIEMTVAGDKVLIHQRLTARGAGSGIEMEVTSWAVVTFGEDGLATRIEGF